jgi:hypothetical protein
VPVTIINDAGQRLSAAPGEIKLTGAAGAPLPVRMIYIRDNQDGKVLIKSVVADEPAVTCRWAPGPNNLATVKIQVDGRQLHGGELQCVVHIQTASPPAEVISIPVHINIK